MKEAVQLMERVARVRQKAREREQAEQPQSEATPAAKRSAKVVKLPLWPEAVRAVPNGFLRSALFGAIAKGIISPYMQSLGRLPFELLKQP